MKPSSYDQAGVAFPPFVTEGAGALQLGCCSSLLEVAASLPRGLMHSPVERSGEVRSTRGKREADHLKKPKAEPALAEGSKLAVEEEAEEEGAAAVEAAQHLLVVKQLTTKLAGPEEVVHNIVAALIDSSVVDMVLKSLDVAMAVEAEELADSHCCDNAGNRHVLMAEGAAAGTECWPWQSHCCSLPFQVEVAAVRFGIALKVSHGHS